TGRVVWTVVAVNARARCKTRLDAALGRTRRGQLARRMLSHVLEVARSVPAIDTVLVVSPERDSIPSDVIVLRDPGVDLNAAFEAGRQAALAAGASGLLLLPADLPLLAAADLEQLLEAGHQAGAAIAPDRDGSGTNGLYVSLECGARMRLAFGPGSRENHEFAARACGLLAQTVLTRGLQADIDTPADYEAVFGATSSQRASHVELYR
ncbi:MAG: 2-phospho-L-lactate guanylyltransferase, partial [Steroidobacteraceae bacterium]